MSINFSIGGGNAGSPQWIGKDSFSAAYFTWSFGFLPVLSGRCSSTNQGNPPTCRRHPVQRKKPSRRMDFGCALRNSQIAGSTYSISGQE
jgi:hypothetical protein